MQRTYRRNYSPITYEKDDIPDLFAAVSREGMRSRTFADTEAVDHPVYRIEARDIHAVMDGRVLEAETPDVYAKQIYAKQIPPRPKHAHVVSPWFAMASGMVVAGAFVMALVAVTPESVIPHGAIAKVVEKALTATVIFSR